MKVPLQSQRLKRHVKAPCTFCCSLETVGDTKEIRLRTSHKPGSRTDGCGVTTLV